MTLHLPEVPEIFDATTVTQPPKRGAWKLMLPLSMLLLLAVYLAWHFGWHANAVTAGALLLAADVLARGLIRPQELPVGLVTALLGGVYLLVLMHRRGAPRR